MDAGEQDLFGRTIDVSSVDKVYFPDAGVTKGDVLDFYARIAQTAIGYLEGRPVAVKRHPDGIDGPGFFQKEADEHFPGWIRREDVPKREGGHLDHVVGDEPATIVYLANQGTIELHPWLSRIDALEHPDQVVFDLDPPAGDADAARQAARRVRDLLTEVGVDSLVKTSGSAGYHVHVRIPRDHDFETTRRFAADLAGLLATRHPDELTDEQRKPERRGRVFVDYLRNAYGQTAVAPYSLRARDGAPVATPVAWDELGSTDPGDYTIANLFRRLGQRPDPWADAWDDLQDLDGARARLDDLLDAADGR